MNWRAARLSQDLLLTSEISPLAGLSNETPPPARPAWDTALLASTERVNKLDLERHSAAAGDALG